MPPLLRRLRARFAATFALAQLTACVIPDDLPPDELSDVELAINGHADAVRVHAILTANDDGTQAPTVTPAEIQTALAGTRAILAAANITLTFDPDSDVSRMNSTLLNHDCTVAPGTDLDTGPDVTPPQDCTIHNTERDRIANTFPGKLVLYFSSGDQLQWNSGTTSWVYGPRGFNWSSSLSQFAALMNIAPHPEVIAHEMGHYLHLGHTFYLEPSTVADARTLISQHVASVGGDQTRGLEVFDADGLADTPPDPGPALFVAAGLDPCDVDDGVLPISVTFGSPLPYWYFIAPDRENIMSYWNRTCRGSQPHISNDQVARVRNALEQGNRTHLIDPKVLYSAIWEPGARKQRRAIGLELGAITTRFQQELAGTHAVHVQAYDIGGNQFRWDAVWEAGWTDQTYVLGGTLDEFTRQHEHELAMGRHLVHMQAYDLGDGQLRRDAIWEPDSTNQTWVAGALPWDFEDVFDQQIAAGQHLVHMQAYMFEGSPHYDAVWEAGARNTTRATGLTSGAFATRFEDELAAGKRLVHMQAYDLGGGQLRWDGAWEDGSYWTTYAIGWAFNDFVLRAQSEIDQGRRLVHMQAYDVGDGTGRVRYDGVWEINGNPTQHRILSETSRPFAARFDAERAAGFHLVMMQAHTGR